MAHLETPAEVRRVEKFACPTCGYHRIYGKTTKEPIPAGGFAFREPWHCVGGCLGFTLHWAPEVDFYTIRMAALSAKSRSKRCGR